MDVVTAASTLRDHMIVLDVAQRQTEFLDEHITTVSQQSLMSHLDGNAARSQQLSLRLSTLEGVKHIYQQISQKKWNQVQTTARSILSELQNTEMTSPTSSSTPEVATSTDRTAATWSRSFCDFYRDN